MAKRPAWSIIDGKVISREFEFTWNGGFALAQKQKNIKALHQAIQEQTGETALEVSSKSDCEIGKSMGAFSLKIDGIYLENVFQASKKYEFGGPFLDLLEVAPKEAKRDERHHSSGKLISFVRAGTEWALEPKTAFYDYLYVQAVLQGFGENFSLSAYDWFTDIEFNPQKSINCQARAIAVYKLLQEKQLFCILKDQRQWMYFHETHIKDAAK